MIILNKYLRIIMKFFVYKIYAIAKAQEKTSGVLIPFLGCMSIFQALNVLALKGLLEDYFFAFNFFSFDKKIPWYSDWIFVLIGFTINYFLFIKTKWVYQVYDEYVKKDIKLWKSNLIFLIYILLLFVFM